MDTEMDKVVNNKASEEHDRSQQIAIEAGPASHILYRVTDIPPLPATLIFALQVAVQIVSVAVTNSMLISHAICGNIHVTAKLMSTNMFMSGLTTLIQSVIGVRLSVFQAPTFYYVVPILTRAEMPDWKCEDPFYSVFPNQTTTATNGSDVTGGLHEDELWRDKLMEVSGVLMVVSVLHALIGATGVGGQVAKVVGPLTIAPAIVVMAITFMNSLIKFILIHVGVTVFTAMVLLILTSYMANVLLPIPYWTRAHGWQTTRSRFLKTYAVLISIGLGWLLCHVLTVTGTLPDDPQSLLYQARTDNKGEAIELAKWFYVPYPGQFGAPKFSLTLFFGLLVAMLSSVIDSLADYTLVSRVCQIPKPPPHATNRGLLIEGLCSVLSGAFGAGLATSTNIAVTGSLALTGVTSRRVFQVAGLLLMFLGIVGKIGAFFVIIPKPVIGAVTIIIVGSVTGTIVAELNDFEMKRPRNCMTVGLALLLGYMIPKALISHQDMIDTGIPDVNNMIIAMFGTPLFVAGIIACFLDNTLPGGRGEIERPDDSASWTDDGTASVHKLPYVQDYFTRCWWTRFVPFLPGFRTKIQKGVLLKPVPKLDIV